MNNKINEEWHLYVKKPLFRVLANVKIYFENIFLTTTISEYVEDSSSIKILQHESELTYPRLTMMQVRYSSWYGFVPIVWVSTHFGETILNLHTTKMEEKTMTMELHI